MIGYVTCRVYPMLDSSHNYIGWVNSSRPDFWMHCHLFQNLQGASCNPDVCQWLPVLLSQTTWLHNLQNFSMKTLSIRNFLCSNLFHHFAEAITSEVSPMLWSLPLSCKILTWRLNWALALESVFGSMQHAPLANITFHSQNFEITYIRNLSFGTHDSSDVFHLLAWDNLLSASSWWIWWVGIRLHSNSRMLVTQISPKSCVTTDH